MDGSHIGRFAPRFAAVGTMSLLGAACGGDINASATQQTAPPPPLQTGVFKDSNVAGLDYESRDQRGVTDAQGRFTCATGQQVSFSIGAVELGETVCTTLAHPPALSADGSFDDPRALNISRLLLMLDQDQNAENGITVSDLLRAVADSWPTVDFGAADFGGELTRIISDVASIEDRTIVAPPSSAEAFAHMEASLACAYSGAFAGKITPFDNSWAITLALATYRDPATSADVSMFRAYRSPPLPYHLFLDLVGTVDLRTLPWLDGGHPSGFASYTARFTTPDSITGTWRYPTAQELDDRVRSFAATRIGSNSGEYRFVGSFTDNLATGLLTLTLSGDMLTGEAFELLGNALLPIHGKRTDASGAVEIEIEGINDRAMARLTFDAADRPQRLDGEWPGDRNGTFTAVGCRLN